APPRDEPTTEELPRVVGSQHEMPPEPARPAEPADPESRPESRPEPRPESRPEPEPWAELGTEHHYELGRDADAGRAATAPRGVAAPAPVRPSRAPDPDPAGHTDLRALGPGPAGPRPHLGVSPSPPACAPAGSPNRTRPSRPTSPDGGRAPPGPCGTTTSVPAAAPSSRTAVPPRRPLGHPHLRSRTLRARTRAGPRTTTRTTRTAWTRRPTGWPPTSGWSRAGSIPTPRCRTGCRRSRQSPPPVTTARNTAASGTGRSRVGPPTAARSRPLAPTVQPPTA